MTQDWLREEVEATVSDYLAMLQAELAGIPYSKTEHRRNLSRLLRQRSDGAIERKHQNISAVLLELGLPCIDGYKPLGNYQRLLFDVVEDVTSQTKPLLASIAAEVHAPAILPSVEDILKAQVPAPALLTPKRSGYAEKIQNEPHTRGIVNYLAREAANQSLGSAGEEFIMRFETARLFAAGADRLASKIERVSVTSGDSAGFDILSFEKTGRERFIEVKTTRYGSQTPFFVSRHEVAVSRKERDRYLVYRVFDFKHNPRFFQRRGQIDKSFLLEPAQYEARLQ
jgi:hypothetical protein